MELDRVRSAQKPARLESQLPQLPAMITRQVGQIRELAAREPLRARAAVRQALGTDLIVLRPSEQGRHVVAEFGLVPAGLATGTSSEIMVAGVGFEPTTFGL